MEDTCEKCPYIQECMDVWLVGGDWCFQCDKPRGVRLEGTHTWVCGNPRCSEYMKPPVMSSTHDYAKLNQAITVHDGGMFLPKHNIQHHRRAIQKHLLKDVRLVAEDDLP